MPSEIERFVPVRIDREDGWYLEMTPTPVGAWVRYEDHVAALASLPDRTGEPVDDARRLLAELETFHANNAGDRAIKILRNLVEATPETVITSDELIKRTGGNSAPVDTRGFPPELREHSPLTPVRSGSDAWDQADDALGAAIAALASLPDRTGEPVAEPIKAHPAEARVSIISRQVRETLRRYGHKTAESSLPEYIAADVNAALKAAEALATPPDAEQARLRERVARLEAGLNVIATTFFKGDQYQDYAKHVLGSAETRPAIDHDYLTETLNWVRRNFAGGSTQQVREQLDLAIAHITEARAAEARLAQQAERATAVMVKPLEWGERTKGRYFVTSFEAHSIVGQYVVQAGIGVYFNDRLLAPIHEIEDAKAAAHADYEARILSALAKPQQAVTGLSEWQGWDQSRQPWSESKHQDAVLEAMFRSPWSMEDAAALIGFIDRTWGALRTSSTGGKG